jgi:hypothetical protein
LVADEERDSPNGKAAVGISLAELGSMTHKATFNLFGIDIPITYKLGAFDAESFAAYRNWLITRDRELLPTVFSTLIEDWEVYEDKARKKKVLLTDSAKLGRLPFDFLDNLIQMILEDRKGNIKNGARLSVVG